VTARALAEAGLDVLVLEEGLWTEQGELEAYSVAQMQRQYRNSGLTVALGRPSIAYTEGRGAGGGSEVNSGLYHRAPAGVLADWSRQHRIDALDQSSLAPWHDYVERELSVAPWPESSLPAPSRPLAQGAAVLGWDGWDVPRWATYARTEDGVVPHKQSMTRTYLPAAIRSGATLRTGTRVVRVLRRHGRAIGVEIEVVRSGSTSTAQLLADHVFVCAGATQTPALLQRSGLHRRIGSNLSVHPTVKVVAEFEEELNTPGELATFQVKEFDWLSMGGSASRKALIALALSENWERFSHALPHWRHQSVYYAAIQSMGRGRVRALPGFQDPVVTYHLTREDRLRLRSGMKRLMHLLLAGGATRIYPSFRDAPVVTDVRSAAEAISGFTASRASLMTVHLTGTVPMGEDRNRAGADSFGNVHGYEQLHVNDASLLPWAPGVNPQGTIMAVAHRNVAHFLARHGATSPAAGSGAS
jgi:choline dehydrogenase-like flavoprotein